MSSYNRRAVLLGLSASIAGCGFTPVYGPDTAASTLSGRIFIEEPTTRAGHLVTQHIEARLGRSDPAPYKLTLSVRQGTGGLGTTATGGTTRYHRTGYASYTLTNSTTGAMITSGTVQNFTGYSATGNTAATLAAERDSIDRLMKMLAEQIIDKLTLIDPATLT